MSAAIRTLTGDDAWSIRATIGTIYQLGFGCSDEQAAAFIDTSFIHVRERDGALVRIARMDDEIVGFLYGYTFRRGNCWPEHVAPALIAAGHEPLLASAFELVELAVIPACQSRGIGTALLEAQESEQTERHCLLATGGEEDNRAVPFYIRNGFRILVPDFRYNGVGNPTLIMGR